MFCRPLPLQREILLWLALTSLAVSLAAVEIKSGGDAEQLYRVRRWTAENGLPQNTIKALVQTRDGYIWAGTLNGLARFDGVRFKVFDHGNTPEMKHDAIDDLAEDAKDGSLWIGTRDVLLRYRDGRFQRYSAEHGILGIVGV